MSRWISAEQNYVKTFEVAEKAKRTPKAKPTADAPKKRGCPKKNAGGHMPTFINPK